MRIRALAGLGIALLSLTACGTKATDVSRFSGEEKNVAQVVADLQRDGESGKADDICSKLLASALQQRIKAAGSTCGSEMKKAINDADAFELQVRSVDVTGNTATAVVHGTDQGKGVTRTFKFTKEGGQWRIADFGTG